MHTFEDKRLGIFFNSQSLIIKTESKFIKLNCLPISQFYNFYYEWTLIITSVLKDVVDLNRFYLSLESKIIFDRLEDLGIDGYSLTFNQLTALLFYYTDENGNKSDPLIFQFHNFIPDLSEDFKDLVPSKNSELDQYRPNFEDIDHLLKYAVEKYPNLDVSVNTVRAWLTLDAYQAIRNNPDVIEASELKALEKIAEENPFTMEDLKALKMW